MIQANGQCRRLVQGMVETFGLQPGGQLHFGPAESHKNFGLNGFPGLAPAQGEVGLLAEGFAD
jgi:hypothetical protein